MERPVMGFRGMRDSGGIPDSGDMFEESFWGGGKAISNGGTQLEVPSDSSSNEQLRKKKLWQGIGLGQVLSLLIALASMSAASLDDRGVNLPSFVNFVNYALITLAFLGPVLLGQRPLSLPWWRYALYALVDVEANTMTVLAYRYTSITSVAMLDAFSIPSVMVLSCLFLGAHYNCKHLVGVVLCVGGLVLTIVSDLEEKRPDASHPKALGGDLLCILGAALYAAANVMQEDFVKNHDRKEFLGMAGLFGMLLSGIQTVVWERDVLAEVEWTDSVILFVLGYSTSLFIMYSWTSLFLQAGDAAMFNLSLLTADIYAVVFAYLVEQAPPNWVYFLAAAVIFTGLFVYHSQPAVTSVTSVRQEIDQDNLTTAGADLGAMMGRTRAGDGRGGGVGGGDLRRSSFCELQDVEDGTSSTNRDSEEDYSAGASSSEPGSAPPSPTANIAFL